MLRDFRATIETGAVVRTPVRASALTLRRGGGDDGTPIDGDGDQWQPVAHRRAIAFVPSSRAHPDDAGLATDTAMHPPVAAADLVMHSPVATPVGTPPPLSGGGGAKCDPTRHTPRPPLPGAAVMLAVFRGQAAEGVDLPDDLVRGVVAVGVPYPAAREPLVVAKRECVPARMRICISCTGRSIRHMHFLYGPPHETHSLIHLHRVAVCVRIWLSRTGARDICISRMGARDKCKPLCAT